MIHLLICLLDRRQEATMHTVLVLNQSATVFKLFFNLCNKLSLLHIYDIVHQLLICFKSGEMAAVMIHSKKRVSHRKLVTTEFIPCSHLRRTL